MDVLVPIDGSECSVRALEFAVEFTKRFEADLHVVHFSDHQTDATEEVIDRAREVLEAAEVDLDPELIIDPELDIRPNGRIGKDIVRIAEERGYDHVVMGHHGSGRIERAIVGSAAETVLDELTLPVTIVP